MHKRKWLNSFVALCLVFISFSFLGDFEDEAELIKTANKHFAKEEYTQAVELFSQLVSVHPQNSEFNYKYGTCLLFASEDKQQAIKFLEFAVTKTDVAPEAYFYLGRAYHLNYEFEKAVVQLEKFKSKIKPKEVEEYRVNEYIKQCRTGKGLIGQIQPINVVSKKVVSKDEFFRSYRLNTMKRTIILKPDEFKSKEDKKADEYSLIVHNPMVEDIYISSYGKDAINGSKDIYKIKKMPDGTFSEPINLGPYINTGADEDYPYLHPSGKILYFASKGHNSIGGYDIFRSELDTSTGLWGQAVNVGFAINSPDDDILYVSDMDENVAYFSSGRANKQGQITVYKILPNKTAINSVLVRGEIEIEDSRSKSAKVAVFDDVGNEVGIFESNEMSGYFIATLGEATSYTLEVSVPGRPLVTATLDVPLKSYQSMIAKRIYISKNNEIVIEDNPAFEADSDTQQKSLLLASARLDINQAEDVDFNTDQIKPKIQKASKPKLEETKSPKEEAASADGSLDLVASAEQELEEIQRQKKELAKQVDAAYYVANKKNIQSQEIKDEIEELSEDLANSFNEEEKQNLRKSIDDKRKELRQNAKEAEASLEYAKSKDLQLQVKEKEEELAESYKKAVEQAENSGNSLAAIEKLEKARDQLDQIQQELEALDGDKAKQEAQERLEAQRNVRDREAQNVALIEQDIADIKTEQQNLEAQASSTKNKALKEELKLQTQELSEELKGKQVDLEMAKAQLEEVNSSLESAESAFGVYDEINSEAADESLVEVSDAQKQSLEVAIAKKETEDQYEPVLNSEKAEETNAQLTKEESEGEATFEAPALSETTTVTPVEAYESEVAKAQLEQESLEAIREEQELLKLSMAGANSRERKQIEEKIAQLEEEASEKENNVEQYVQNATEQKAALSSSEKTEVADNDAVLAALSEKVGSQDEATGQKNLSTEEKFESAQQAQLLETDVETATSSEIEEVLANGTGIRKQETPEVDDAEIQKQQDKNLQEERKIAALLKEAAELERKAKEEGNEEALAQAEKKKAEAVEKRVELAKEEGEVNKAIYVQERSAIESEMFSDPAKNTTELKEQAKEVSDAWIRAEVRRSEAEKAKDPADQIRLINEAQELEQEAFAKQESLKEKLQEIEEQQVIAKSETTEESEIESVEPAQNTTGAEQELAIQSNENVTEDESTKVENESITAKSEIESAADQTINEKNESNENDQSQAAVTSVVEAKKDEVTQNSGDQLPDLDEVLDGGFDEQNPDPKALALANEEGYGIKREVEFNYGPSPEVKALLEEAQALEAKAAKNYYDAQLRKLQAESADEKTAKKLLKEADKLMQEGQKLQLEASEKYAAANKAEYQFNQDEIQFALDNEEIVNKDSAAYYQKQAESTMTTAEQQRTAVQKEKIFDQKVQKINEAYASETEAINDQNKILSGEIDPQESTSDFVPAPVQEKVENAYTKQADDLRSQANSTEDPVEKRRLNELAREYELAGDDNRTAYIESQMNADKAEFDNNMAFIGVSRDQANNNTPAEKAFQHQLAADSIYQEALKQMKRAEANPDKVTKVRQIKQAQEMMAEAKAEQAEAIRKFQESKAAPDEEGFTPTFRKEGHQEEAVAISTTVESESELPQEESPVYVESTQQSDPVQTVDEEPSQEEEVELAVDSQEEETITTFQEEEETTTSEFAQTSEVNEASVDNQQVNELPAESTSDQSAVESYEVLLAEAKNIERQESARVERIESLKKSSAENKQKSEALLAQVDGLTNESEIMAKISEANKYRDVAEQQEIESKNEEIILTNNIAEAKAKRQEAKLILDASDDATKKEMIRAGDSESSAELSKVEEFIENPKSIEEYKQEVEMYEPSVSNPVNKPKETAPVASQKPKTENQSLLGGGTSADQSVSEEFSVNNSAVYTSASQIPMDPPMPDGLIYQVQVGAFRNAIDPAIFNGLSPLVGEQTSSGIIRYKVGYFRGFKSANMAKGRIRKLGYPDAFVVVFYNGKRISADQAEQILANSDESEQFVYQNLVEDEVQALVAMGISESEANYQPDLTAQSPVVTRPNPTVNEQVAQGDNGLENDLTKIEGMFYTVQVGVFSSPKTSSDLNGVGPLYTERTSNGYIRYTTGVFRDFASANAYKAQVQAQGIGDAFVTAYSGNERVSVADARAQEGNQETSDNSGSNNQGAGSTGSSEVVFMVQVGAYRTPIEVESTPVLKDLVNYQVSNITTSSGVLIYMVGGYSTKQAADNLRQVIVDMGIKDAFVVAIQDGQKISMAKAMELTNGQ